MGTTSKNFFWDGVDLTHSWPGTLEKITKLSECLKGSPLPA